MSEHENTPKTINPDLRYKVPQGFIFKMSLLLVLVSLLVVLYRSNRSVPDMDNRLIMDGGKYLLDGGQKRLIVHESTTVSYELEDLSHHKQLLSENDACNNMGFWALYWEKGVGRLWELSSDAGYFVWIPDEKAVFQKHRVGIETEKLVKSIPKDVYNKMHN